MLPEESRDSLVVFTQDSAVKANLTRRVDSVRIERVELARELAAMHLARVEDVYSRLAAKGHTPAESKAWLEGALTLFAAGRAQADGQRRATSVLSTSHARQCEQLLRQIERGSWELTLKPVAAPLGTALGTSFDTLPEYWQFIGETGSATRGPNLLPAADFEDLQAALGSGWHYFQHPQPRTCNIRQPALLTTTVTPTADAVHGGKSALRLEVAATNAEEPPLQVETAPMWLVSPPMPVEAGRVMLIHGWVNIPKRIVGSVDGLLILDSISGEPLAERILQTNGWQEFSLYRAAPRSGTMTVTFALSGMGEAFLDDVTVQWIDRPSRSHRIPNHAAATASQNAAGQRLPHHCRTGHRLADRPEVRGKAIGR